MIRVPFSVRHVSTIWAQVNRVLRRPGLYGRNEMAVRLLLEAMSAVDGSLTQWRAERDRLRERVFAATCVDGAYSNILPTSALRDATATVYAEIAHRLGWPESFAAGRERVAAASRLGAQELAVGPPRLPTHVLDQLVEPRKPLPGVGDDVRRGGRALAP